MPILKRRELQGQPTGWPVNFPPSLVRIYAARGVLSPSDIEHRLSRLLSPRLLGSIETAAAIIGDAILQDKRICITGDYDCDGATGTATAVRGLKLLGAKHVSFAVPNRFRHGYGLSPGLVEELDPVPDLIVTVDSGTSSFDGIDTAKARGIAVVVTDHHLPADRLPNADAIVNPNLDRDPFPSKALAGVGVMFYTLLAVRQYLFEQGIWNGTRPDLTTLLDIVAIGTVADLVPLDFNNRILVHAGLQRIRAGLTYPGIRHLIRGAKRTEERMVAQDIAFALAPRINAAGRLEDMTIGVKLLLADTDQEAEALALQLEQINGERKDMQANMIEQAEKIVEKSHGTTGVTVYDPSWHSGIVGLVASKLKEALYRPVFAFAPAEPGSSEARGSGRSIPGFHLRDALAVIDARYPGLMKKFGGHAMAAGMSIELSKIPTFEEAFDQVAKEQLTEDLLSAVIYTDGELLPEELSLDFAYLLREQGPWGQAFPEPIFEGTFYVDDYRVLAEKHVKLDLTDERTSRQYSAIYFNAVGLRDWDNQQGRVRVVFELNINTWRDQDSLQLMVRHIEEA